MFKNKIILLLFLLVFSIAGFGFCSEVSGMKFATVNINNVIMNSDDVTKLKEENKLKQKELNDFIENAKTSLENETDIKKRKQKEDSYNIQLKNKKDALDKDYKKKLDIIDKKITAKIQKTAKSNNYDLVFSKSAVLYGGDDITNLVIDKK